MLNASGATLIVAGPGSGKTRTLVYRVCRLLEGAGAAPENILLLTFTNKAAREMKARVERLVGSRVQGIVAGTFHHFANILLRNNHTLAGLPRNFTILDEEDANSIMKEIVTSEYEKVKKGVVESMRSAISISKLRMISIEEVLETPEYFHLRHQGEEIVKMADQYEKAKAAMGAVDFDDLLVKAYELLKNNPELRERYSTRFTNILVDEFQDTDPLQGAIVRLLYRDGNNLLAVGDDSQSIYSFRGAEIRNMLEFKEKYGARVFFLRTNYRSTHAIVSLVNACIKNSKQKIDKELVPIIEGGEKPTLVSAIDKESEALIIGEQIAEQIKEGLKVGVLFRAAHFASELEIFLARTGIKYEMRGGIKFFEQRHIKDMIALLRVYENPKDRPAQIRLVRLFPKIGERAASIIVSRNNHEGMLGELMKKNPDAAMLLGKIFGEKRNAAEIGRASCRERV